MDQLLNHVLHPLLDHPDEVKLNVVEGEASILLELTVHPDDRKKLEADDGRALRSIRTLLSAAAGSRKASLDLVDDDDDVLGAEE